MQIDLNRGVDEITFGMTEADVISKLGRPDKLHIDANGSRDLIYFAHKLILKIEPNDRLGWIEVHNKVSTWAGLCPWNFEKEVLLRRLSGSLNDQYEIDDYGRMESYSFNRTWVELQYEFGELSSFNFGAAYDDNDEPIWPI